MISYAMLYRSLEAFIDAVADIERHGKSASLYDRENTTLATITSNYRTTAILEAGRRSLDNKCIVKIVYGDELDPCLPTDLTY